MLDRHFFYHFFYRNKKIPPGQQTIYLLAFSVGCFYHSCLDFVFILYDLTRIKTEWKLVIGCSEKDSFEVFPCCHIQLDNVARYTSPLRVLHCPPVDITGKVVLQFQAVFFFFLCGRISGERDLTNESRQTMERYATGGDKRGSSTLPHGY